jgi:hypothetical protein
MILYITIFFIATITAFIMLSFRAWEIKTSRRQIEEQDLRKHLPELSFRHVEKILLILTKHVIQSVVVSSVKVWFIFITKAKILIKNKLPKINKFFKKRISADSRKITFVQRAIIESKIKIKKVKEVIKKEHEEKEENKEVDKIL